MLRPFLTEEEAALLREERELLLSLKDPLIRLEASPEDLSVLDRALLQLDELFLLVVVGEFNAGKSAVINALLGQPFLPEGVTPTTTQVQLVRYDDPAPGKGSRAGQEQDLAVLSCPVEWLQEINIVDTPGTNAVIRKHQRITEEFIPRADLVLFVTSVDRPFSESERVFLTRIREWGKKVIFIVNKIDILHRPEDLGRVVGFVKEHAQEVLTHQPIVFPVSARLGLQAKTGSAAERDRLLPASGLGPLEQYILETLDERERLRLKLESALGVADRVTRHHLSVVAARVGLLHEDIAAVEAVERQVSAYEADMQREFGYHLTRVDNVLYALTDRGNRFFDDTIRLGRVFDLVRPERVQALFQKEVVADTSAEVELLTQEMIDWMVRRDLREWQSVAELMREQMARRREDGLEPGGQMAAWFRPGFDYDRQELLGSVGRAARQAVESYDQRSEAAALAESLQRAVAQAAIVEVSAIGLGALMVKLLAAAVADVTGVLAAGALAALGLYVIPFKRAQAKRTLQARVEELRSRLGKALSGQFERELRRSVARIREAVTPYARFVESERGELRRIESALRTAQEKTQLLSDEVARPT